MTPVNVFTGFLGVGKTTAVIDLLKRKPAWERWAVLVNEYGEVGIDAALIEGAGTRGVNVREVSGGCVCCASAPELPVALHFLLTEAKPTRLLIETTGLGHPARLLDFLRDQYSDRLEVRATIGLVAPDDVGRPGLAANPVFQDQIHLADVLVLNQADRATPEQVAAFAAWAEALYPPKLLIAATARGRLDPAWLDLSAADERVATPPAHAATHPARGWVFPLSAVFDEDKLWDLCARWPAVERLKGVFRVGPGEWVAVQRAWRELASDPSAYRRDSRVEVIAEAGATPDWAAFGRELEACRIDALWNPER